MTSLLFTSQETGFVNSKLILGSDTMHDVVDLPDLPRYTWKFCYSDGHQICEIGTRMALSWSTDIVCWTRETMDQTICDSVQCDGTTGGQQIRILLPKVWTPPRKTVSNKVSDHWDCARTLALTAYFTLPNWRSICTPTFHKISSAMRRSLEFENARWCANKRQYYKQAGLFRLRLVRAGRDA